MSSSTPAFAVDISLVHLFRDVEKKFEATSLSTESWYILMVACIVASPDPELAAQLYIYLREQYYPTAKSRQGLMRRLREALVKCVAIIGVCKPIEAVVTINEVENDEDKDYTSTRREWQCNKANHEKGMESFERIYASSEKRLKSFDSHRDFAWLSTEITYGLYLSDRQVLDEIDSELVVLPAIMMQNLRRETQWHIKGARRLGLSKEDMQVVWDCVHSIAGHFGVPLNKLPTIEQVEHNI
ncbi:hypothetical protein BKA67DRAFT_531831 [Truncatella angustata]|uniref:Carboxymuconolactone decarboxylase-like domain-containing protein n=1 Tax=Truncatella angustata TaxID=152316 RepID=A0A9P8ZYX6_9PEZI|nr:uncharacterized protein BKA67DRAFT_531831 [Truncatella angustata]KAH6656567.1 hypothetical protein BKA67DRAFT_531831 [Truncatella angustata]KAH8196539.1 hypothetical protein TruAng_009301 [Truncatella angustata]